MNSESAEATNGREKWRLRLLVFAFMSGICIVLVSFAWGVLRSFDPFRGQSFDKTVWDTAFKCSSRQECIEKEWSCIRGPMYQDLKFRYLRVGTSQDEVMRLLGVKAPMKDGCLYYDLGACSGFGMDGDYLRICLDPQQRIQSVDHHQG